MEQEGKEIFFVNLKDPLEIRKGILESSKRIVKLLQRYENIKGVRIEKTKKIKELKKNFSEINLLVNKLKQEMPQINARIQKKNESDKSKPSKKTTKKTAKKSKNTEILKLEDELKSIENKLKNLS